jgi:hypothetical protein
VTAGGNACLVLDYNYRLFSLLHAAAPAANQQLDFIP